MMLIASSWGINFGELFRMSRGKILSLLVPQFPISEDETEASKFVECSKSVIHTDYIIMVGDKASYIIKQHLIS